MLAWLTEASTRVLHESRRVRKNPGARNGGGRGSTKYGATGTYLSVKRKKIGRGSTKYGATGTYLSVERKKFGRGSTKYGATGTYLLGRN